MIKCGELALVYYVLECLARVCGIFFIMAVVCSRVNVESESELRRTFEHIFKYLDKQVRVYYLLLSGCFLVCAPCVIYFCFSLVLNWVYLFSLFCCCCSCSARC